MVNVGNYSIHAAFGPLYCRQHIPNWDPPGKRDAIMTGVGIPVLYPRIVSGFPKVQFP